MPHPKATEVQNQMKSLLFLGSLLVLGCQAVPKPIEAPTVIQVESVSYPPLESPQPQKPHIAWFIDEVSVAEVLLQKTGEGETIYTASDLKVVFYISQGKLIMEANSGPSAIFKCNLAHTVPAYFEVEMMRFKISCSM